MKTTVRSDPDLQSPIVHFLLPGKTVHVIDVAGRRALIDLPVSGWVSLVSGAGQNICEAIHNQTVFFSFVLFTTILHHKKERNSQILQSAYLTPKINLF